MTTATQSQPSTAAQQKLPDSPVMMAAALAVPTVEPLDLHAGDAPILHGTADPTQGSVTTVIINEFVVDLFGTTLNPVASYEVAVDAAGNWTLDLSTAIPDWPGADPMTGQLYTGFTTGPHEVEVVTTLGQDYTTDASSDELYIGVPIPFAVNLDIAPTVDALVANPGEDITLTGTADVDGTTVIDVMQGDEVLIDDAPVTVDANGGWSFDLSGWLSDHNLAPAALGPHEIIVTTTIGSEILQDASTLELNVLPAPPAVPTVNPLEVTRGNSAFFLTGTASTAPGAQTIVTVNDASGDWFAVIVTPDANGTWRLGGTSALWHNATDGSNAWGMTLESLFNGLGAHEVSVRTTLNGVTVNDTTHNEVTTVPTPPPTVEAQSVALGGQITLTGRAVGSDFAFVDLFTAEGSPIFNTFVTIADDGSWSLDLTALLSQNSIPPLGLGQYEIRLTAISGFMNAALDATTLELTIIPPQPTSGDDSLTGSAEADLIDLLAGNDSYSGGDGDDTIIGGAGADTLFGDAGDDTFVFGSAADLAAGESIDGGEGIDAVTLRFGGSIDISGLSLTSIDYINLPASEETDLTVANLAQAAMVQPGHGIATTLHLADSTGLDPMAQRAELAAILSHGIGSISWGDPGRLSTARLLDGARIEISSNDRSIVLGLELDARGVETTQYFDHGTLRQEVRSDRSADGNGVAWRSIVTDYTATGTVARITRQADSGIETVTEFSDGLRQSVTLTDRSSDGAAAGWQSITTDYDSNDLVSRRTQVSDTGVTTVSDYTAGIRTHMLQTDASADGTAVLWTSIQSDYDASGALTARHAVYDDGSESIWAYVDGVQSSFARFNPTTGDWTVTGSDASDTLVGSALADRITGGLGDDTMTGGDGADIFVFRAGAFGADTITDFTPGADRLNLRAFGIAGADAYDPALAQDDFDRHGYSLTQLGEDVVLDLGPAGTITLHHVTLGDLRAADFF